MKVQLHRDTHVVLDAGLIARLESRVAERLSRFDRLVRVDVHLADDSGGKRSGDDVRCTIDARPAGLGPVVVEHAAPTVAAALDGATDKAVTALTSALERRAAHRGETIRQPDRVAVEAAR